MHPIDRFVSQASQTGVILDTNIALLLIIGSIDQALIPRFKRTHQFAEEDYTSLNRFLSLIPKRITTPNIVTEVSNLSSQLKEDYLSKARSALAKWASDSEEIYEPTKCLVDIPIYMSIGIADTSIYSSAKCGTCVLTDDYRLAGKLQKEGLTTLNFNNIRMAGWKH